jgi:protein O-GlcNAc transferase
VAKKNILTQSKKKKASELAQEGRLVEASEVYQQICASDQVDGEAWFMLGVILAKLDKVDESITCLQTAANLRPEHALTQFNLGVALRGKGRLEEAARAFRQVLRLEPLRIQVYEMLGATLSSISNDRIDEVVSLYRERQKMIPRDAVANAGLGSMLHIRGDLEEAIGYYRMALQLNPAFTSVYGGLAGALSEQGKFEEASEAYQLVLKHNPHELKTHTNYLLTLHYLPGMTQESIFAEHKKWDQLHGQALANLPAHLNSRDANRKLRIGYVSSDFRAHSVAFFLEPILASHDKNAFEIICYSGVIRPDATTQRLRELADKWRDIGDLGDIESANIIRADQVDILVDLAGHAGDGGLKIFTHKPAPVQLSYLGYPDTTGIAAMDFRLTDALADPQGQDVFYTEKLVRLPGGFLCYRPLADSPPVALLPALENGYVTFVSFNNLSKINLEVVALWAGLLQTVPNARLFIKSPAFTDLATRDRYYALFEAQGATRDRVELIGRTATQAEHLALYSRLDIALDTFPYNGTTTTCEAMWMGVPVVTLAGKAHAGRVGLSLLTQVGLTEWIAETPQQYLSIAAEMAKDVTSLAALRAGLRERMAGSSLCDEQSFTRKLEEAYRQMWRTWCTAH